MPLYALMIEDGYGHGQVVHYAATSSEDSNHIESIMQSFKECNFTWSMVSVRPPLVYCLLPIPIFSPTEAGGR